MADYDAKRKTKFIVFTLVAVAGTSALYLTGSNALLFGGLIFILTNLFFELAMVLYDSFLVTVSTEKTSGRISGLGYGLGYLGGIVAMLALNPFFSNGYANGLDSTYRLTFPLTALFFLIFALPAFLFIKEEQSEKKSEPLLKLIKIGFRNTLNTIKEIGKHKKIAWFMVALYFMHDGLTTLFVFIPIYLRNALLLNFSDIFTIFMIIQVTGFPATFFFGWLSDKLGPKKILLCTIGIWVLIIFLLSTTSSMAVVYVGAVLTGLVIGSSQAIARSWLSRIIPVEKRCEFFGFNAFASKAAAVLGPVIFGLVSSMASQRIAMLALMPFFVISFVIFCKIKE
jgi:UMF1 family MFS transporter